MLGGLTPPSRYLAATAQSGGKAYIFGGGGHGLNDTWELDFAIKTWTKCANMLVALSEAAAAVFEAQSHHVLLS